MEKVFIMATSSITKNFVISGKEQVEMFVNAIEESAKNRSWTYSRSSKVYKGRGRNAKIYGTMGEIECQ